jgi:site-specific DNA recombinase
MYDIYIRVSRLGERSEDEATEVYEEQCRDWAVKHDIVVDEVAEDTDVSGSVAVADRTLERLIQKVENGESEGILTPYLDRLGRDNIESCMVEKRVTDADGRLIAVKDGYDSISPNSRLLYQMRSAIAEDGFRRVKASYQAAIDRKIATGAHIYKPPFGYHRDEETGRLVMVESDAKLVREVFERHARSSALT